MVPPGRLITLRRLLVLTLGVRPFLQWHHHHRHVHRRGSREVAARTDRLLHEWARHHLEIGLHGEWHSLGEQVILTWVHVLRLELRVLVLEVSSADDRRLLRLLMWYHDGIVVHLRRPVLHHVLVHRQDHWITDGRNRLPHILRRKVLVWQAQLRVNAS